MPLTVVCNKTPVLSWDHLKYWMDVEADIRALVAINYPTSVLSQRPRGACVVQLVTAWFGENLDDFDEGT